MVGKVESSDNMIMDIEKVGIVGVITIVMTEYCGELQLLLNNAIHMYWKMSYLLGNLIILSVMFDLFINLFKINLAIYCQLFIIWVHTKKRKSDE